MKIRSLLAILALTALTSCGAPTFRTASYGADGRPASTNLVTLPGLGQDVAGFRARFPDGSGVEIESINQSRGLDRVMAFGESLSRDKLVFGPAVKGFFGGKKTETVQSGLTERAKIAADADVAKARLAPIEPIATPAQ